MIKQFWMFSRYFDFFFRELIPWRRRVLIFYTLSSILKLFGIVLAISFSLAIWNFSNATFLRTSNFEGTSIISDIEHTHKYLWFPASEFRQPVNHRYPIFFLFLDIELEICFRSSLFCGVFSQLLRYFQVFTADIFLFITSCFLCYASTYVCCVRERVFFPKLRFLGMSFLCFYVHLYFVICMMWKMNKLLRREIEKEGVE